MPRVGTSAASAGAGNAIAALPVRRAPVTPEAAPRAAGAGTQRRGFTLIELLVVIAVIALLVSVLVPSLVKARQQAKLVACLANHRALFLGLHLYAADSDGYCPRYSGHLGLHKARPQAIYSWTWYGTGCLIKLDYVEPEAIDEPARYIVDPDDSMVVNYVTERGWPSNEYPYGWWGENPVPHWWGWYAYWFIDFVPGTRNLERRRRVDRPTLRCNGAVVVEEPTTTAFFMCHQEGLYGTGNGSHDRQWVNAVFEDGHAESFDATAYFEHPLTHKGESTSVSATWDYMWWRGVMDQD